MHVRRIPVYGRIDEPFVHYDHVIRQVVIVLVKVRLF